MLTAVSEPLITLSGCSSRACRHDIVLPAHCFSNTALGCQLGKLSCTAAVTSCARGFSSCRVTAACSLWLLH